MLDIGPHVVVAYSLALCAVLLLLTCVHFRSELSEFRDLIRVPALKHLVYRPALRSKILVEWSRADILAQLAYLGVTIFSVYFKSRNLSSAGLRAANLSLIHMVLLFASPRLDSLSNALGLSWRPVRRLHASVGVMASLLLVFHMICVKVDRRPFPLVKPENLWGVVSASSLGALLLLSVPFFKRKWYEAFLRLHQSLAILLVYGLWMHLTHKPLIPRIYLYSLLGICGLSGLLISFLTLRRNAVLSRGFPRATITQSRGAVVVTVALSRPLLVKAGQQINLCLLMPATSFRSLFQSHPFVVASWSDAPQSSLDLLIEPRGGLTRQLLVRSSKDPHSTCPAIFTGPYGIGVPVGEYGVVLMIASGFGIAAQLPYLKQLLHGYNSRKIRTRRIHLVWELKTLELPLAIERLLNNALDDDTLDDGYILQISVYVEYAKRDDKIIPRANVIKGVPDWDTIVREEATGKYIKRVQEEAKIRENMIVTVSASSGIRVKLQDVVQRYIAEKVEMVELDYQPDE